MKQFLLALLVMGAVAAPSAGLVFADSTPPIDLTPTAPGATIGGVESTVQTVIGGVIDDLDLNTVKDVAVDQVSQSLVFSCPFGTCPGKIIIEQAGNDASNAMGIYDLSDAGTNPDRVVLFSGSQVAGNSSSFSFDTDGTVIVNGVDTNQAFDSGTTFGLYIETEAGAPYPGGIFFSEDARNPGSRQHVLTFHTETGGVSSNLIPILDHSFLFAFEDKAFDQTDADFDYNDFIYNFQVQTEQRIPVIPEPGTMLLFGRGGLGAAFTRRRKTISA